MPTQFPNALDNFTNPLATDKLNNPSHSTQHTNINDAMEAVQVYLGTASSVSMTTITGRVVALEAGGSGVSPEEVQDIVGAMLVEGTGINIVYDDAMGKLTISTTGGTDAESVDGWSVAVVSVLPPVQDPNTIYFVEGDSGGNFLPLTGGTMTGDISFNESGQTAFIGIVPDALSPTGEVFNVGSNAGTAVHGPYIVLDTTNLQINMPGAIQNAAITVAAIDSFGVVSLGYTALPPPSYAVSNTNTTPVIIKPANTAVPTAWVSLGLQVTLAQDIPAGTGNIQFEGVFVNPTIRTGTVEFGLRINGGTVNAREIITQISANFNQTIAMALPMINAYVDGDVLELMARVTVNDNNQFSLEMANSATDVGAMRIYTIPSGGSGGTGTVNSVGAVAPLASSGGTDPQISMPAASTSVSGYLSSANFNTFNNKVTEVTATAPVSVFNEGGGVFNISMPVASGSINGYLSAANFNTFNNKANPATSLAGYGITNAYTKTEVDSALALKAPLASPVFTGNPTAPTATVGDNDTTIATTAFTVAEIGNRAPTKTGTGATGTWPVSITGTAAIATAVNDNGAGATLKFWYGTEAQYTAMGTKDATTLYFRSA